MVEKVITDREIIYKITKRKDSKLVIQYNPKNNELGFKLIVCLKGKQLISIE